MKISKLEEQSIRLVVTLALRGGRATLPELALAEGLTEAMTAKLMGKLRKGGIIQALRGRTGGYALIPAPEDLTVSAVIRSLGNPVFEGCASDSGALDAVCPHISGCSLRPVWNHLARAVTDTLDRITISQLIAQERPAARRRAM